MTPSPLPPLMTAQEVADALRVKPSTVIRLARELGGVKIGRSWVFRQADVERYIERKFGERAA